MSNANGMSKEERASWQDARKRLFPSYEQQSSLIESLATLAHAESGGNAQRYEQLIVGPGKKFPSGKNGIQGLAGSAALEEIRAKIANLPPPPAPSTRKPAQTGGRKRQATQHARRKNRRLSRRNK
jgi:hypothetical protein